jgi:hypothetical protein
MWMKVTGLKFRNKTGMIFFSFAAFRVDMLLPLISFEIQYLLLLITIWYQPFVAFICVLPYR